MRGTPSSSNCMSAIVPVASWSNAWSIFSEMGEPGLSSPSARCSRRIWRVRFSATLPIFVPAGSCWLTAAERARRRGDPFALAARRGDPFAYAARRGAVRPHLDLQERSNGNLLLEFDFEFSDPRLRAGRQHHRLAESSGD